MISDNPQRCEFRVANMDYQSQVPGFREVLNKFVYYHILPFFRLSPLTTQNYLFVNSLLEMQKAAAWL